MKEIIYKVNVNTSRLTLVNNNTDIKLTEYENVSTTLVFQFDRPIKETDRLVIQFKNSKFAKPYRLIRISGNKYITEMPREILVRGRLEFTIHHYDELLFKLAKYSPEAPLYVTKGLDIANDTMDSRPDLFAEMLYRIELLEKEIEQLKTRG